MKLVAGLGNPGRKYEATRHNAGFWWIDALARAAGVSCRHEARFHGEVAKIPGIKNDIWLLKPATYMNESGRAVGALADFFKIAAEDILIVHDELDLAPGVVKLKFGGSASGNGVRSVAARLGTRDFWRLRIGIGHPRELAASEQEVVDYVLHAPRAEEQRAIDDALSRAGEAWPLIAAHDMQAAMLRLHTRDADAGS
ncbi:MAG: aminoacyl-tRNA hydrolase [Betaproteobacteria bacterium]|jgi:PTH1 family peptidyl-tRNA hydrolase|nr:aminoacyl-tRNA hydrolase [Betaproteobacteria bacterium]MDH5342388.1 aminoacyl-tRNA hydrolase [Betaproteobacteria bacterium]